MSSCSQESNDYGSGRKRSIMKKCKECGCLFEGDYCPVCGTIEEE